MSTVERVIKDVQAPAFSKPTDEQFFSAQDPSKPDIAFLKNHFYREGRLTEEQGGLLVSTPLCAPPSWRRLPDERLHNCVNTLCGDAMRGAMTADEPAGVDNPHTPTLIVR